MDSSSIETPAAGGGDVKPVGGTISHSRGRSRSPVLGRHFWKWGVGGTWRPLVGCERKAPAQPTGKIQPPHAPDSENGLPWAFYSFKIDSSLLIPAFFDRAGAERSQISSTRISAKTLFPRIKSQKHRVFRNTNKTSWGPENTKQDFFTILARDVGTPSMPYLRKAKTWISRSVVSPRLQTCYDERDGTCRTLGSTQYPPAEIFVFGGRSRAGGGTVNGPWRFDSISGRREGSIVFPGGGAGAGNSVLGKQTFPRETRFQAKVQRKLPSLL